MKQQTFSNLITIVIGLLAMIGILSLLKAGPATTLAFVIMALLALFIMSKRITGKKLSKSMRKAKKMGFTVHSKKAGLLKTKNRSSAQLVVISGRKQAK